MEIFHFYHMMFSSPHFFIEILFFVLAYIDVLYYFLYVFIILFLSNSILRTFIMNSNSVHEHNRVTKVCPECRGNIFTYDDTHAELCCDQCGLVLLAPSVYGLDFPGFLLIPRKKNYHLGIKFSDKSISFLVSYNLNK